MRSAILHNEVRPGPVAEHFDQRVDRVTVIWRTSEDRKKRLVRGLEKPAQTKLWKNHRQKHRRYTVSAP